MCFRRPSAISGSDSRDGAPPETCDQLLTAQHYFIQSRLRMRRIAY